MLERTMSDVIVTTHRVEPVHGHIDWQANFVEHEAKVDLSTLRAKVEGETVYALFETDNSRKLNGDTELTIFNLALLDEQELEQYHSQYPPEMMPENREISVEMNGDRYTLVGILEED
jgi:hypothetical protein